MKKHFEKRYSQGTPNPGEPGSGHRYNNYNSEQKDYSKVFIIAAVIFVAVVLIFHLCGYGN